MKSIWRVPVRPNLTSHTLRQQQHRFSSTATGNIFKRHKVLTGLAIGTGSFATLYYTNDTFALATRHTKHACGRIWTVTVACTKCFSLYRKTLNGKYESNEAYKDALSKTHLQAAEITRKAIEKNSGVFIKLGQHIAALTYIFPEEWTSSMTPLQDQCPTSSYEEIEGLFRKDVDSTVEDYFDSFDREPMGTASLAQVHRATLKDDKGTQVAVKVQHPSLEEFVPLDVLMTKTVFNLIDYFFKDYPLTWLSEELQSSIFVELDFTEEAKNSQNTQRYFKDFYNETALRVPDVVWAKPRILVMEFLRGARLDEIDFYEEHGISRNEVSSCLSHLFNNMIFTPGVGLHCDPHPGNLAIIPREKGWFDSGHNFEIVLYDHGLYRYVPTDIRRSYARFWLALLDGDEKKMRQYAYDFAGIDENNFRLFSAAITGRDFENATSNVMSKRTEKEKKHMSSTIAEEGLLSDIMVLLHSMPRIVLLILKTNDLTRYLDEKLKAPLGPERTFLIMAMYCAQTVYEEERERIYNKYRFSSIWWTMGRMYANFTNWIEFFRRKSQVVMYDFGVMFSNILPS